MLRIPAARGGFYSVREVELTRSWSVLIGVLTLCGGTCSPSCQRILTARMYILYSRDIHKLSIYVVRIMYEVRQYVYNALDYNCMLGAVRLSFRAKYVSAL